MLEDLHEPERAGQTGASSNFKAIGRLDAIRAVEADRPPIQDDCGL